MDTIIKTIKEYDLNLDVISILSINYMKKNIILPLRINGNKLQIAMENSEDKTLIEEIESLTNFTVKPIEVIKSEILEGLEKYITKKEQQTKAETASILRELNKISNQDFEDDNNKNEDIVKSLHSDRAPIVKAVNAILVKAVGLRASDIHIEPYEKEVRIRFRLDGVLVTMNTMPKHLINSMVSRIKIMGKLNITEKRLPQDGSFRIIVAERRVDFRVSTMNTIHGEKVVIRILDTDTINLNLTNLGFESKALETVNKIIKKPYGIILVTGPTGSGKSTTLYSILNKLNSEQVNISTAEDPVEYQLNGINQVQCKPEIGLTFATALRSFLRQDPDIIMVGEIRDKETAEIAIKAALTGHLVLSTLHTNDAPSSIQRLLNMGVEPYLISSSISMVIAQRLIRKVCPYCSIVDKNSKEKLLAMELDIHKYENVKFKIGEGCDHCNNTGYKGRSVIYEILEFDDEIKTLISKKIGNLEIKNIALKKGMVTLRELGLEKAKKGITSLDEVMRITLG